MTTDGPPEIAELNRTDLSIRQPLRGGGTFSIICRESKVAFSGVDGQGKPLHWAWDMVGGTQQKTAVQSVTSKSITYNNAGISYQLRLSPDAGFCEQLSNGTIRLNPDSSGKLGLILSGFQ